MTDVVDLRQYGESFRADPHPVYAELRRKGPVHRVLLPAPDEYETWLVVGHEEARAALADPRLSKDPEKLGSSRFDGDPVGKHMLASDPPQHTRLRTLVSKAFTPRRVEALRPRVQEITDELLDRMLPAGRADLVESLAYPLPMAVICELLGVPEGDRAAFRTMSNDAVAPATEADRQKAAESFGAYLTRLIEDKRTAGPGDDLLSELIDVAGDDGDRLCDRELIGMAFVLLLAGHETTVNLITGGVHALLTHPDQLELLRADMGLLEGAVEETLRYDGPVETATFRFAAEPLELAGVPVARGDQVMIGLAAANRDPGRHLDPNRFDIRRVSTGHLAFGHGIHFCLGAPLARLEARIAIGSLLRRAPGLALDGPPGEWLPGMLVRGLRALPLKW
ncbi:cytochrome P450 [Streptomyces sp. NPDC056600]|uniref:cytochrome P450 family protein n=1 Tax=Streptomyces sp. NPDC056600 TaxID=3345874 RepID=UPI0036C3EC3C